MRRLLKEQRNHKFILLNSIPAKRFAVLSESLSVRCADCLRSLLRCNIIVTAQGSGYSDRIIYSLRKLNWKGYWVDASSSLRRKQNALIVLDPINLSLIKDCLARGIRIFVGGNCTVSLMLLGVKNIVQHGLFTSLFITTLQSASGAGARYVNTMLDQTKSLAFNQSDDVLFANNPTHSLALTVVPWIDEETGRAGTSREEQKGYVETLRIGDVSCQNVTVNSTCIRVSMMRCHAQNLFVKLTETIGLGCFNDIIQSATRWVKLVPNIPGLSKLYLSPHYASSTLTICVGRLKKLAANYFSVFTIGDQLLWGAAEPISRLINLIIS